VSVVITTATFRPPRPGNDPTTVDALTRRVRDRITGATTSYLTLSNPAAFGLEQLFKNGLLMDPLLHYSLGDDGVTVALSIAAVGSDVFIVDYWFRSTRDAG
jgi:hypothetical protein